MARPIDEKIVRMTLDNARFKDNVKDTITSFNSINDAINSSKAADLSTIAEGISKIEKRFSALGVVAASVINDITTRALEMGRGLYRSLVDPLIEGGKKRALNIEQAKFQFEGLGMDVEKTMESANQAVLGTAFGLDEAAVVASQFGATGMRAGKEMTEALRGISGVAAMTGASYSDIGNIFTNVAGNGRLMGNDLLRLGARGVNAAATLGKAFNKTEAEIREMVTKGEISFQDFAKAMSEAFGEHATKANETYRGSLSNLNAALARIGAAVYIPRFENMRDIFNATTPKVDDLAKALDPLIEAINELSGGLTEKLISAIELIDFNKFAELGGITNIVEGFWNIVSFGESLLTSLGQGFRRVFPGSFMNGMISVTEGFKNLTSHLRMSDATAEKVSVIFQGLFSVFSTVGIIAKELAKAIFGIIPPGSGNTVLDFAVLISEMAIAFNESVKEGNFLTETIQAIGKVLGAFGRIVKAPIDGIIALSTAIRDNLGKAIEWLRDKLAPVGEWFKEAFSGYGMDEVLGGGFLVAVIMLLRKLSGFFDDAKESLDGITGTVSGIFTDLGNSLKSFQEKVKYNNLMKIGVAIGLLAISLKLLEGMDISDIAKGIGALTGSMAILAGGMLAIEKMDFTGGIRASATIIALATSVTIMAAALKALSGMDLKELGTGLLGLAGIVGILSLAIIGMSRYGGKMKTSSLQLIALATSVRILASAVEVLSQIKTSGIAKSVIALGVIFAELAIFLRVVDGAKIGPGTALGLIGTAAAIKIIVSAIDSISQIDVAGLTKGLVTIGLILGEIALFSKLAGGPRILAAGAGILAISIALSALMIPVTIMGKMSWEELAKGLGGMAVALIAVGAAGSMASGAIIGAAGIMLMAVALNALMPPILIFSNMSWGSMIKGFVGIGGGMAVLAGAALLLSPAIVPMLGFSAAMLALGIAATAVGAGIALFGVGLTTLATLTATSVNAIISALSMLIRGFGTLIGDVVGFVVDLSIALIGGIVKIIPEVVEAIAQLIVSMLQTLATHTPEFVTAGYDIIIGLLEGIQEKGPELQMAAVETVVALMVGMADAISENREPMVSAMVRLMGEVILVVIDAGIKMVEALFGWLPGVSEATAKIGDTATEYIEKHFGAAEVGEAKGTEFATSLGGTAPAAGLAAEAVAQSGRKGLESIDSVYPGSVFGNNWNVGVGSTSGEANKQGTKIASTTKDGAESVDFKPSGEKSGSDYASGVESTKGQSEKSGSVIAKSGDVAAGLVDYTPTGVISGNRFSTGVGSTADAASKAASGVASSGKTGFSSVSARPTGVNFGNGFALGIGDSRQEVIKKATSLAVSASRAVSGWLKERSPSRRMMETGDNFGSGFGIGITDSIRYVIKSAKRLAVEASKSLVESLDPIDDKEIRIKVILDDDDLDWDDFDPENFDIPRPSPTFTNAMVTSTDRGFNQNGNIYSSLPEEIARAIEEAQGDDERVVRLLEKINGSVREGKILVMEGEEVARITEPYVSDIQDREEIKLKREWG